MQRLNGHEVGADGGQISIQERGYPMIPSHIEKGCPIKRFMASLTDTLFEVICHDGAGTPDQQF
jgi:hypothetical protein